MSTCCQYSNIEGHVESAQAPVSVRISWCQSTSFIIEYQRCSFVLEISSQLCRYFVAFCMYDAQALAEAVQLLAATELGFDKLWTAGAPELLRAGYANSQNIVAINICTYNTLWFSLRFPYSGFAQ